MEILFFITTAVTFIAAFVIFHLTQRAHTAQISKLVADQRAQIESVIVGLKSSHPVYEFTAQRAEPANQRNDGQVVQPSPGEEQTDLYPFNYLRADGRDFELIDWPGAKS